ncbi:hypothetical protein [Butyrivibrio sp. JL13D10]
MITVEEILEFFNSDRIEDMTDTFYVRLCILEIGFGLEQEL